MAAFFMEKVRYKMKKETFSDKLRKHTIDIGVVILMLMVFFVASQAKNQQTKQQKPTTVQKIYNDSIKQNIR